MKIPFFKKTTVSDLIFSISTAIIVLTLAITTISYHLTIAELQKKFEHQSQAKINNFAVILTEPVWNLDTKEIDRLIRLFSQSGDIVGIEVTHLMGRQSSTKEEYKQGHLLTLQKDINYNNEKIATINITFSSEEIIQNTRKSTYITLFIIAGIMIAIIIIINILSRHFIEKPFSELLLNIDQIASGRYGAQLPFVRQGDINIIINRFNNMSRQIASRDREISKARQLLNNIIESMPSILITTDEHGIITHWNHAATRFFNIDPEHVAGKNIWETVPLLQKYVNYQTDVLKHGRYIELHREEFSEQEIIYMNLYLYPLLEHGVSGIVIRMDDVTELVKKEEQLQQSQKMETLGSLAGGLAHDFNNVLAGIVGTLSLMKYKLKKYNTIDMAALNDDIQIMAEAATRASDLVKQLLTFARKDKPEFVIIDLKDSLRHIIKICINTFDRSIRIEPELGKEKSPVKADPGQIEQMILNICVNASHAMTIMREEGASWGGTLSISLEKIVADQYFVETHPEAENIDYWNISIRDTGVGMDSKTLTKIFDPFFTTKSKGLGTGLGLSMVYSIARLHRGFMDVYSETGFGTTFNIYLPVFMEEIYARLEEEEKDICRGEGTILVVDDEPAVRRLARNILEECGYRVITAGDGADALAKYRKHPENFILILLDIIMPVKSGDEAYFEFKKINPEIKILLTSGFRQDERINSKLRGEEIHFLQKPFTMKKLSEAVYSFIHDGKI